MTEPTAEQMARWKRFFDGFGYVHVPGLLADDIDWITETLEEVFEEAGVSALHDGTRRSSCPLPLERSGRLSRLIDLAPMDALLRALVGEDYVYLGSGADFYVGGGMWHPDGTYPPGYVKVAMYLEPLTRQTGALRVVPGSHLFGYEGNLDTQALWGLTDDEVHCVAPDNTPGDVLAFNPNTLHNSLGGGDRRCMLNFMACRPPTSDEEWQFFDQHLRRQLDFPDQVRETAGPERLRHLRLLMEREARNA